MTTQFRNRRKPTTFQQEDVDNSNAIISETAPDAVNPIASCGRRGKLYTFQMILERIVNQPEQVDGTRGGARHDVHGRGRRTVFPVGERLNRQQIAG